MPCATLNAARIPGGERFMLVQNLAVFEQGRHIQVNHEGDPLFYDFDYDVALRP